MTKIKICGIRTEESAKTAAEAGADYLGFIFVPQSKRYISPKKAKKIISSLKNKPFIVGLFKDQTVEEVQNVITFLSLDFVQLHGIETPAYCKNFSTKVLKVFSLPSDFKSDVVEKNLKEYPVDYFLFDREKQGEGSMINLYETKRITTKYPIFFAGGLTPDNVANVVKFTHPYAVDVSGGIETDGKADMQKIITFIKNTKEASL